MRDTNQMAVLQSWARAAMALMLAAASTANAQEAGGDAKAEEPKAEAPAETPPPEAPKPEPKPEPKAKKAKEAMPDMGGAAGGELDAYGIGDDLVPPGSRMDWAKRRDIRVVQKREVVKEGRHGLSLLAGVVPNDDFWTYLASGVGYNYYFSEDLALNVHGVYTYDKATSLRTKLESNRPEGYELQVRLPQTLVGYASAGVDWNLLHGKIGFFGTKLGEFDLAMCFGVGAVMTKVTTQEFPTGKLRPDLAGNVGGYLQFYLSERFALRADYHHLFYPAFDDVQKTSTGGLARPLAVTVALTWFTAPPQ